MSEQGNVGDEVTEPDVVPLEDKDETEPINDYERAHQTRREDLNPSDDL